jgi:putative methyltransferase (TIGR04325 family)
MVRSLKGSNAHHVWDGLFLTWEEACNNAEKRQAPGRGLQSKRWLKRITQQLSDYRKEFQKYGVAAPPRPCNLPLICAIISPRTIIDFGGSSGWSWEYLKNSLPNQVIKRFEIIETKKVVKHMKTSKVHAPPVTYKTLDESMERCDLLYCNSVLQYFNSNNPFLFLVEKTKPRYIFLEDCAAHGDKDFFSTQNYHGSCLPYRFIGLKKLLTELSGYMELSRNPYLSPIQGVTDLLEMGNFPKTNRLRYTSSVLLKIKFEK